MARPSKEALEAKIIDGKFGVRATPPIELNEKQQSIWERVTRDEPTEFFSTGAQKTMLQNYCEHVEAADKITSVINAFETEWIKSKEGSKRYGDLLKLRDSEVKAAASLATKLRLTNQSRYTPQAASTASKHAGGGAKKPWEI